MNTPQLDIPILGIQALAGSHRPPMLIEDFVPRMGSIVVASESYAGKTFLALEMARAVAFGGKFLGQYPAAPGRVLFVEVDSPDWDLRQQFDKVIGLPDPLLPPEEVENRYGGIRFILDPAFVLNTHGDVDALVRTANANAWVQEEHDAEGMRWIRNRKGFDLIVLDTLVSVHQYDENATREMQHVAQLIRRVARETGAAVIMLHHFNKGSKEKDRTVLDRVRGATALPGAVDGVFALVRKRGQPEVRVLIAKNRAAPHMGDFTYLQEDTPEGRVRLVIGDDPPEEDGRGSLQRKVQAVLEGQAGAWVDAAPLRKIIFEDLGRDPTNLKHQEAVSKRLNRMLTLWEKAQLVRRSHGRAQWIVKGDLA